MKIQTMLILFFVLYTLGYSQTTNKFQSLETFLHDSCQTTGMVIMKNGKEIFNYGNIEEVSYLASCRKSVLAMLYGPFVESGLINLNETLLQIGIDDIDGLLPIEKTATIDQILTARSGIYHKASNEGDASDKAPKRGSVKPGSFWLYNNWDFNVAGYILEKKTGLSIYKLMDSLLAKPLHFQDWDIKQQRKFGDTTRSVYPAYHMFLSTRDMAKIGQLMLQNGLWEGKKIISKKWVKKITSVVTSNQEAQKNNTAWYDFSYGYYWWLWDKPKNKNFIGAYSATGAFGQYITIIPKMNMVVAHKTRYPAALNTPPETYFRILNKIN